MDHRSTASFGKRQEYIAVAELLRRGFDVYMTLVDDQQIDCVIRQERKWQASLSRCPDQGALRGLEARGNIRSPDRSQPASEFLVHLFQRSSRHLLGDAIGGLGPAIERK